MIWISTTRLAAALLGLSLAGCSFTYVDSEGAKHVLGFVNMVVPSSASPETFAGPVVAVSTVGLSVGAIGDGGWLSLGYAREVTAVMRDNALVLGNPLRIGEPAQTQLKSDAGGR